MASNPYVPPLYVTFKSEVSHAIPACIPSPWDFRCRCLGLPPLLPTALGQRRGCSTPTGAAKDGSCRSGNDHIFEDHNERQEGVAWLKVMVILENNQASYVGLSRTHMQCSPHEDSCLLQNVRYFHVLRTHAPGFQSEGDPPHEALSGTLACRPTLTPIFGKDSLLFVGLRQPYCMSLAYTLSPQNQN